MSIFTTCSQHKILLGQSRQGEWNGHDATEMAEMKIKNTQKLFSKNRTQAMDQIQQVHERVQW